MGDPICLAERVYPWQASGGLNRNSYKDETSANRLEYMRLNSIRKGLLRCRIEFNRPGLMNRPDHPSNKRIVSSRT
jgi:hypothetical protein